MSNRCPICKSISLFKFNSKLNHKIFQCSFNGCRHYFIEEFLDYYQGLRESNSLVVEIDKLRDQRIKEYGKRNKILLDELAKHIELKKEPNILDYGSGDGYFLEQLLDITKRPKIIAFEPEINHANFIKDKSFKVVQEICDIPDNSLDLVILNEVIEHIPEPIKAMTELHSKLRLGGAVYIATPSGETSKNIITYYTYDVPNHLHFFTNSSLEICLSNSGFSPLDRFGISSALYRYIPRNSDIVNKIKFKIKNTVSLPLSNKYHVYPMTHLSGVTYKMPTM
jgi:2-polyprenyl-3-methyl-5-hydroxy-6-metoxy-1,4-benzoquinol methylase